MAEGEKNEFVALEQELAPGKTLGVEVGPYKILLCNVDGELFGVENYCTHSRVSLSYAELKGGEIECKRLEPFHKRLIYLGFSARFLGVEYGAGFHR